MTEKPQPEQKDDINYFKKKLICQIIDGDYEAATVSLRRLKLMEDADVTYRLTKNQKELDLPNELSKQIIEDQETFKLMEELLPKLIYLLPFKGIILKEKIDNIKKRLGISYVVVLWKALVCLDENCTFPIDGPDYKEQND
jgi:hypothetical protein